MGSEGFSDAETNNSDNCSLSPRAVFSPLVLLGCHP